VVPSAKVAEGAAAGADDDVAAGAQPAGDAGVGGHGEEAGLRQPEEQVAAGDPLGQLGGPGADGDGHRLGGGEFGGDLQAGVGRADHEHPAAAGQLGGIAVGGAVQLHHARVQACGEGGDVRELERAGGDHDLPGAQRAGRGAGGEGAVGVAVQPGHRGAQPHRQGEVPGVGGEVVGDVVLGGMGVGRGGERQARQRVVPGGTEQPQGVPAVPPRGADLRAGVDDEEAGAAGGEVVAEGESGLAGADDEHVEDLVGGGTWRGHGIS
jgi:hypothetical protein